MTEEEKEEEEDIKLKEYKEIPYHLLDYKHRKWRERSLSYD